MADEEQNETPPETPENDPAESEETEATPPSSDPEVSEDAEPAAPSGDTPEATTSGDEPTAAAEGQAPQPDAQPDQPEAQPDGDPAAPGREAEEADGGDVAGGGDSGEEPQGDAAGSDVKPEAKAKDKPPGADLEPIAIEEERELTAEERARLEAEEEERARAEAAATDDEGEEPAARRSAADVPADARIQATGKRKSAIARVVVTKGDGKFKVNRRELAEYFPREHDQSVARQALVTAGYESSVDVSVRVHGGGVSGQAGAVRHGIARALTEIEPELRRDLKRRGLLTRDARRKERRKAGLKKARKRPQFSKR